MLVTQPSAAALLVAEVTRASRLAEINRIDDKRISMIRQLAEVKLYFHEIFSQKSCKKSGKFRKKLFKKIFKKKKIENSKINF